MDAFQAEVIERLTRLETVLENGLRSDIARIKAWIEPRPRVCPLVERRNWFARPVTVALAAAIVVKAFDWGPALLAMLGGKH